ncbi:MAG: hypothetical protein E6I97_23455 [Chloroflexi bacterium]|nr:MAG: hypothetical protein E6I97_23455 [Chloroflexota bacterium]
MNNYYLLVPPIKEQVFAAPQRNEHTTVKSSAFDNLIAGVGDKMLMMHSKGLDYEGIIPNVTKIVRVNQQASTLTLETEKSYNKKVPIDTIRTLLNSR